MPPKSRTMSREPRVFFPPNEQVSAFVNSKFPPVPHFNLADTLKRPDVPKSMSMNVDVVREAVGLDAPAAPTHCPHHKPNAVRKSPWICDACNALTWGNDTLYNKYELLEVRAKPTFHGTTAFSREVAANDMPLLNLPEYAPPVNPYAPNATRVSPRNNKTPQAAPPQNKKATMSPSAPPAESNSTPPPATTELLSSAIILPSTASQPAVVTPSTSRATKAAASRTKAAATKAQKKAAAAVKAAAKKAARQAATADKKKAKAHPVNGLITPSSENEAVLRVVSKSPSPQDTKATIPLGQLLKRVRESASGTPVAARSPEPTSAQPKAQTEAQTEAQTGPTPRTPPRRSTKRKQPDAAEEASVEHVARPVKKQRRRR